MHYEVYIDVLKNNSLIVIVCIGRSNNFVMNDFIEDEIRMFFKTENAFMTEVNLCQINLILENREK